MTLNCDLRKHDSQERLQKGITALSEITLLVAETGHFVKRSDFCYGWQHGGRKVVGRIGDGAAER